MLNEHLVGLRCMRCHRQFPDFDLYSCPRCGGVLETIYEPQSFEVKKGEDMWRYSPLLPTKRRTRLRVGGTPLYRLDDNIYIKDDTRNPTHSLKDRASAVVVQLAKEFGYRAVACASTGNAAVSLAGISASEGIPSYILVPNSISKEKLCLLLVFGAHVLLIDASYDDCFDLCTELAEGEGWYNRNTAYNPYTLDGKKTVAFEIADQLHYQVPDRVYVPVGDGCIISAVWKGFRELYALGVIDRLPELVGVQAEGCSPLATAFDRGVDRIERVQPDTLAESIAVGVPRNGEMALRDVRASGGKFVTVSDGEMVEAMKHLASTVGIFGELAGVASMAGLMKEQREGEKKGKENETAVVLITGSGVKDMERTSDFLQRPPVLEPTIGALRSALRC